MLEDLLSTLLGICLGTITGLIPGIHVNLVAQVALSTPVSTGFAGTLVALAVTHSFLDVIPGVLLGAPESDTALGVLPGHRYVLRGWGYMAVKLTLVGSYYGLLIAILLIPLWWYAITLYPLLVPVIGYVLLGVSGYMIFRDKKRGWAFLVYVLSGVLGWLLLNNALVTQPLFPMLSGLFGTSTLLYSLSQRNTLPPQDIQHTTKLRRGASAQALLAGNVSGFLTSMLPGLGSAQAAILGMHLTRKIGDHGFLIMIGTINTVNFSLSLLTWLALDKARNGAVVAIQQLTAPTPLLIAHLFVVAIIAGSIAVPLCLGCCRGAILLMNAVPYRGLVITITTLITALVWFLTGWRGVLILMIATAIGLIPAVVKCGRAHAMGCLMLPVALYFL